MNVVLATERHRLFRERPSWSSWVTPRRLATEPVHRWFTFPHSYSGQLVEGLIREWSLADGDVVLDPFVGAGTTLLAAQAAGFRAAGFDLSPLAELVSRVKVGPPNAAALRKAWAAVNPAIRVRHRLPSGANYDDIVLRAFPGDLLPTLDGARRAILDASVPRPTEDALLLALLAALPTFSRLVRKGGWLEERTESAPASDVRLDIDRRLSVILADLDSRLPRPLPASTVAIADARSLPLEDASVSAVVTSPPYPNRHDYTRVFGVELQFAFLDWSALRKLRYQSFSSHPEARPVRTQRYSYREPAGVENTIAKISYRIVDSRAKVRIPRMLHGYFEDLYLALREIQRVLKDGGHAALVLGNVSYCGVALEVDRLTAEIARQAELEPKVIYVARRRGNSAQQMKEHGRRPQRESVVVLVKK